MNEEALLENANSGVLVRPPEPSDFIVGAENEIAAAARLETGDWRPFLGTDEQQISLYFDTMACVTFSATNCVEAQVNWMVANGLIPEATLNELKEMGYFDEKGKFNCSDRFTAKMSGTTRRGNYLTAVWDSIRNDGLLPEKDWAYPREQRTPVFDWDDYYKEIPQELKDKAKKLSKTGGIFDIAYQWLVPGDGANQTNFSKWLKAAPIQLATAVCPPWNTSEVVQGCSLAVGHATMMFSAKDAWYDIEDHYKPFQKRLALNYPIPNALQGIVSLKSNQPPMPQIDQALSKRLAGKLLLAIEDRGAVWYVTPEGKRAKIGRSPEEVAAFLQAINDKKVPVTGITNADIAKIAMV